MRLMHDVMQFVILSVYGAEALLGRLVGRTPHCGLGFATDGEK